MARPKYIADLHEAKYELRMCSGAGKEEKFAKYKAARAFAAKEAGCPEALLEAAIRDDFGIWIRQERLPKLPPPPETKSLRDQS